MKKAAILIFLYLIVCTSAFCFILPSGYDALNRVTEYTDTRGNIIKYAYDKNNNLTKLTYPGLPLKEVNYTYDTHNRLKTVTDWNGRITTYTWDKESRLTDIVRPNNTTRHLEYDAAGQLLKIEERDAANILIAYYKYSYDNGGRITSRFALPKTKAPTTPLNTITYDDDNRIATYNGTAVTHDADGNMLVTPKPSGEGGTNTLIYDTRNRLTAIGNQTYQYDAENNRISATENTQTTNYIINPNAVLSQLLIKEKSTGEKTFYVYGIGLLHEVDAREIKKGSCCGNYN